MFLERLTSKLHARKGWTGWVSSRAKARYRSISSSRPTAKNCSHFRQKACWWPRSTPRQPVGKFQRATNGDGITREQTHLTPMNRASRRRHRSGPCTTKAQGSSVTPKKLQALDGSGGATGPPWTHSDAPRMPSYTEDRNRLECSLRVDSLDNNNSQSWIAQDYDYHLSATNLISSQMEQKGSATEQQNPRDWYGSQAHQPISSSTLPLPPLNSGACCQRKRQAPGTFRSSS